MSDRRGWVDLGKKRKGQIKSKRENDEVQYSSRGEILDSFEELLSSEIDELGMMDV